MAEKNWLFSDTPKGAKASADIYSIVETAKSNGLDVFKYSELLLAVLPSMAFLTNPDILEELLPWDESVQKICKSNMSDPRAEARDLFVYGWHVIGQLRHIHFSKLKTPGVISESHIRNIFCFSKNWLTNVNQCGIMLCE